MKLGGERRGGTALDGGGRPPCVAGWATFCLPQIGVPSRPVLVTQSRGGEKPVADINFLLSLELVDTLPFGRRCSRDALG